MINFGPIPIGAVLPIPFAAYAAATGESVTLTGLAVTDIEVYKGTSMTQRSSDAGYTLMDTDGIDIDGVTGLHGFSIDTGDNTDAGFYAAGSFYTVVVSAVTIDSQTVTFIAATFRCVPAETSAGVPKTDVSHVGGTSQTAGDIIGDTNDIQSRLPAALVSGRMDSSVGAMAANVITAAATAADFTTEVTSGLSTLDAAGVRTAVGLATANLDTQIGTLATAANLSTVADYLDTEIAAILADTNELQTDWANGGRLDLILDARASQATADNLVSGIIFGSAATGTLSTTVATTSLTGYANDQLIGRVLIWLTGNCEGEATTITDYASASGTLTFTALTTAPANADTFKIV